MNQFLAFLFLVAISATANANDAMTTSSAPETLTRNEALLKAKTLLEPAKNVLETKLIEFYTRGGLTISPMDLPKPNVQGYALYMGLPYVWIYTFFKDNMKRYVSYSWRSCDLHGYCPEILGYVNTTPIIGIYIKDKIDQTTQTKVGCYVTFRLETENLLDRAVYADYRIEPYPNVTKTRPLTSRSEAPRFDDEYHFYPFYTLFDLVPPSFEVSGCQ